MWNDFSEEGLVKLQGFVNNEMNPVKYLAIDPGESNGICGYDARYYTQFMTTIPADNMTEFIHSFENVDVCVLEDYRLFPNKAKDQYYSPMKTLRVIGKVEDWAKLKKVKLVEQPSRIKSTGYAWAGKKPLPKSNPLNHALDAHIHFIYWGVKNGRIDAARLLGVDNSK